MKAIWNNTVIAESDDTVVVEKNHYFPLASVNSQYLTLSETTSICPWKGTAHYYTLAVNGRINPDAGWHYLHPKEAAKEIAERVAFWKGVEVKK